MTQVNVSRRTLAKGMAWTVPAVAVAAAAPATAASGLTINAVSPAISYVDAAYTQQFVAGGGSSPYTWSYEGALPAGVNLDSTTGLLTGRPSATGTYNFTVTVTDSAGATASTPVLLDVTADEITAAMLQQLDDRRSQLGLTRFAVDSDNTVIAKNWADNLATSVHGLQHQNPLPAGVSGENLSATCSSNAPTATPAVTGGELTDGWLSEPHSYTDWVEMKARDAAKAQRMYDGTGEYQSQNPDGTWKNNPSGHRINIETPRFTTVGLGQALTNTGSACGSSYQYGYFGVAEFGV